MEFEGLKRVRTLFYINGNFIVNHDTDWVFVCLFSVCSSGESAVSVRTNGPFRWNEAKNTLLLRELYSLEPFLYKVGSKEAGQKWTEVAEKLNCFSLFRDMPRDQRSVMEQFNKLLKDYKNKKNKEEKASGINPDPPTENETLLEEIVAAMESTTLRVGNANSKKDDQKTKDALACRDKAMTTWAKAGASGEASDSGDESATEKKTVKRRGRKRRASSDPFQYLAARTT